MISIDIFPDEVLLDIFDFYVVEAMGYEGDVYSENEMEAWRALVHVCRRWRSVVFGSPRRLKLKLVCTTKIPVRDRLDLWPALPLVIDDDTKNVDNIIGLLKCSDRINQISLSGIYLEDISEAMEVPFPELTYLVVYHKDVTKLVPPLSDSFLGGSAPRLRYLSLNRISFPGIPKLLSSATHLTDLHLERIPHSGYISSEAMVTCLATLTNVDRLSLGFQSPQSRPDRGSRHPPLPKRTVLPALVSFSFRGVCEYLENIVACIDAPRLNFFDTTFFNDIVFDTPQFTKFISRTPTMEAFDNASVVLWDRRATIELLPKTFRDGELSMVVSCGELDWQFSFLEQVCTSFLPHLSVLEDLYITNHRSLRNWGDGIESSSWLELLSYFDLVFSHASRCLVN